METYLLYLFHSVKGLPLEVALALVWQEEVDGVDSLRGPESEHAQELLGAHLRVWRGERQAQVT